MCLSAGAFVGERKSEPQVSLFYARTGVKEDRASGSR